MRNGLGVDHWPRKPWGDLRTNGRAMGTGGGVVGNVPTFRPGKNGEDQILSVKFWGGWDVKMGGKKVFNQKTRWWFQTYISFSLPLFFELSCFGYLFGACFASIIQLGDIPNTYINIHLFKGVYIGLISKGVPIPRAFPPFCLWIRGFPMLPGY